ncbi:putative protease [Ruminococcaceae bacterium FB2012]|nr:putative protease [Ruminococcaceae bacterium FB2012]
MTEILAPCGSPEVLTAALRTGCTAVYLGGEAFSARANAKNFSREELAEAVRLCHIRGVKVYQAINTVITDRELSECAEAVKAACELGIDGLITQDLAVAEIVKNCCPGLEIHASTQMTLHTAEGFLFAKELGFSRAVASRELPESILRELCALPIECEVFVHGALCMSVSGQCYMSAVIGSRSANRGKCAQACRLPVSAVNNGRNTYALSLKDMSHLPHLRELEAMGAASLKIEGRMKRPEYVAAAVNAVRSELEGKDYDTSLLEGIFSRSGFTDGYYTGRPGREMFGHRSKDDVEASAGAIPALHELYRHEFKRSEICMKVSIKEGEKVTASASDENGITAEVSGGEPQKARTKAADKEYLVRQFSKLGDTVYTLKELDCEIGEGMTLPAGELSSLRRELCSELDEKRYEYFTRRPKFTERDFELAKPEKAKQCGLRIYINNREQLSQLELSGVEMICAGMKLSEELLREGFDREKLCAVMPRFTFDEKRDVYRLEKLAEQGLSHIECTNYAHIRIGRRLGMKLHGGFGLNVTNTLALRALRKAGLTDCTVSFELKASEIAALGAELDFGFLGYGRLPMMLTANCPIAAQRGCKGCTGAVYDRTGRRMPVKCSRGQGYVEILNSDILHIGDRLGNFPSAKFVSLAFYEEDPRKVRETAEAFRKGIRPEGEGFTKGLYFRGVK